MTTPAHKLLPPGYALEIGTYKDKVLVEVRLKKAERPRRLLKALTLEVAQDSAYVEQVVAQLAADAWTLHEREQKFALRTTQAEKLRKKLANIWNKRA